MDHPADGLVPAVQEHICSLMRAQGVTREDLARRLGVTPATISNYLTGENITTRMIVRIYDALGYVVSIGAK